MPASTAAETSAAASRARPVARLALALLLLGAVAIAFSPIFVRLSEAGPVATGFWRVFLALPVFAAWMRAEHAANPAVRRPQNAAEMWGLIGCGLFLAADLAAWHWSIRFTSVANSTLLANFAPIFVTLASWLLFHERFTRTFVAALALALVGAVVLMGASFRLSFDHLFGDGLALLTAVFYAGYLVSIGRLRGRFSTVTVMVWSSAATAACLLPTAILSGETVLPVSAAGWLVLLGLGLVSHVAGQSLIAYAMAHLPAAFSSISLLLQPAVAAGLGWLLLGEALGGQQAAGALVILCGIFLARRGSR